MAKAKPTLFEQIRDDERADAVVGGPTTSPALRIAIIAIATLGLMAFLPGRLGDTQRTTFDKSRVGTIWTEESVIADYPFPVPKAEDVLQRERTQAIGKTEAIVVRVPNASDSAFAVFTGALPASGDFGAALLQQGRDIINTIYTRDVIDVAKSALPGTFVSEQNQAGDEQLLPLAEVLDSSGVATEINRRTSNVDATIRTRFQQILQTVIVPTIRVNRPAWSERQAHAAAGVATTTEIIHQGDVIVRKGQRVDNDVLERLAAYRFGQFIRSNTQFSLLVMIGAFGHAFVLIGLVVLYLYYVRRTSFERNGQLATLLAMPLVSGGLGWASIALPTELPLEYMIVVPGMAMLVSILYDVRTAIVVTVGCAFAVAATRGNDHVIAVVLLVGGVMAAYSATNLRSRTQVFTSILAIAAGLAVVTVSIELERDTPLLSIVIELGAVAANAVLSPLLAFGIIILLERTLNVATDLRLEDFDNINHPLLLQLNERAPGTYQHTMAVSRLAESAAAAIGANALLARVGAFYHDVGKLEKSEYFIENQIDIDNKHDRLAPKRSAAIIRQHVQDGIELAKEYGLPDRIWKFIPMHHGTILIKHFYAKAIDEATERDVLVEEQDYRYPGPKPDSKETGIVMLADAAEALSRLVDTSSREQLERAVSDIIVDRLRDGQLNDTPLTLSDLDAVRESFVKSLLASTHPRVRYKDVASPVEPPTSQS